MRCGIYEIECLRTGQRYVGQSINTRHRFREHHSALNRGCHENSALQTAWDEHGEENFSFGVIEDTARDRKIMTERERHWVDHFRSFDATCLFNVRIPFEPVQPRRRKVVAFTIAIDSGIAEQVGKEARRLRLPRSWVVETALRKLLGIDDADVPPVPAA